jgi:hypothetical protein
MGRHERVKEMVELATAASILERCQQPCLVLYQRMIDMDLR